jgi:hypothetical protein
VEFEPLFSTCKRLDWMAYLAIVFGLLNEYFSARTQFKYKSLQVKLNSWISELNMKKTFMFQFLPLALRNEAASPLSDSLCTEIEVHLLNLREEL